MAGAYFTGKAKEIIAYTCANYKEKKRIVPIDIGLTELSPPYVLRIFRQFGFTDDDIEKLLERQ